MDDSPKVPGRLPRLQANAYRGHVAVHWTLTTHNRQPLPLCSAFHRDLREVLFHTLHRAALVCPIYTVMPDHLHMIWMGIGESSDQRKAMAFFSTYFEPLILPQKLQPQPHDHVLRPEDRTFDGFQAVCSYIQQNPVRAGFVAKPEEWKYTSRRAKPRSRGNSKQKRRSQR
jgi:putative transposase